MALTTPPRLGLRANLAQFSLLVGVNGLVGALVGQERSLVPLLAAREFGVRQATSALAFVATFGVAKALTNFVAGTLSDRIGRKPVLIAGWLVGIPVPLILIWAPSWAWVVAANVLLGINQGLTWSATVIMKVDLAGPERRGLALGLNEFAGYLAVAISAWTTGLLAQRYGLRPEPLFLGLAVAGLGLGLSALVVKETREHARHEAAGAAGRPAREVLALGSFRHRQLAAASRTGMVNNANDALAWGLLPLLFVADGLSAGEIGLLAGLYPAVWGICQLATGPLSDRLGRRLPIAAGMWLQGLALAGFAAGHTITVYAVAAIALGFGTALVYPALLASVGDFAGPAWRAAALGTYRLWRDGGYVVGALVAGVAADLLDPRAAVLLVGGATALSGVDAFWNLRARQEPAHG